MLKNPSAIPLLWFSLLYRCNLKHRNEVFGAFVFFHNVVKPENGIPIKSHKRILRGIKLRVLSIRKGGEHAGVSV